MTRKKKKDRLTYLSLVTFPWNRMRLVQDLVVIQASLILLHKIYCHSYYSQDFRKTCHWALKSSETRWINTKRSDKLQLTNIVFNESTYAGGQSYTRKVTKSEMAGEKRYQIKKKNDQSQKATYVKRKKFRKRLFHVILHTFERCAILVDNVETVWNKFGTTKRCKAEKRAKTRRGCPGFPENSERNSAKIIFPARTSGFS